MSTEKESPSIVGTKRESSRSRLKPSSSQSVAKDVSNDSRDSITKRVSSRDKEKSKTRDHSMARSKEPGNRLDSKTSDKVNSKPKLESDQNKGARGDATRTKENRTTIRRHESVIKDAKIPADKAAATPSKSTSKTVSKTASTLSKAAPTPSKVTTRLSKVASTPTKAASTPSKVASQPSNTSSWISAASDQPPTGSRRLAVHKEASITKETRTPTKLSRHDTTTATANKVSDTDSRRRKLEERVKELGSARIRPGKLLEDAKDKKVLSKHRRERAEKEISDTTRHKSRNNPSETRVEDKIPSRARRPAEIETREKKPTARSERRETEVNRDIKPSHPRTRTRNLSPSEVKMLIAQMTGAAQNRVGENEAGHSRAVDSFPAPVASTSKASEDVDQEGNQEGNQEDDDDDYEDDFEDYESDFEDDSSSGRDNDDGDDDGNDDASNDLSDKDESVLPELTTTRQQPNIDEEKKMDSGSYEMAENQRRSKLHLHDIKEAMLNETVALNRERDVKAPSPADEGFEEGKSEEMKNTVSRSMNFINFATARKRQKDQKLTAKSRKRGEQILSMITLDVMQYKLFEKAPVAYDAFIAAYGRTNGVQASSQTNEDNLSEETQTEDVATSDRWTQRPTSFQTRGESAVKSTVEQDRLGVGCSDSGRDLSTAPATPRYAAGSYERFVTTAGALMLRVLLEEAAMGGAALRRNKTDVEFSKGHVTLGVAAVPVLAGRSVTVVRYAAQQPMTLLTVHRSAGQQSTDRDASRGRCIVCVWDVADPATPQAVLAAWHDVTAACFDSPRARLVMGGLDDGSVCVWDLRERAATHEQVNEKGDKWLLRSPTYSTAEVLKMDGHLGRVVSLQPLIDRDESASNEYAPTQVCSMEECGVVIVWTVIQSIEHGMKSGTSLQDLGMAHWGRVRLVKTSSISLADNLPVDQLLLPSLTFTDLQLSGHDCNHLFVSSVTGHVVHGLKSGGKPMPRLYLSKSDEITFANCVETFPFGHNLFLVGCGDGSIRLHRRESENPLTTLAGTGEAPGQGPTIRALQWSRSRPTIFFVLDDVSRIHVWDLGRSDMYPRYTATLPDADVTAIQLAPDLRDGKTAPQMAIATAQGTVDIHELTDEYKFKSSSEMTRELNNFIRFTNIL